MDLDRLILRVTTLAERIQTRSVSAKNRAHLGKLKSCGADVRLNGQAKITGHTSIVIERNVHIGAGAFIRGEGGLRIGENTHISRNLLLYTMNHQYEGTRLPYDESVEPRPVDIGRNVWVGMNVCIAPGTTIGDGAIIGMGTVVAGHVPPLAIVGSEKWRILGWRDEDRYRSLDEGGAYGGINGRKYDASR
jgi:maltose O-acetyltransferase